MPRKRDPGRFGDLVRAATRAFIEAGSLSRAQVDDVARLLGVAKGTVYLWVESKEALFDLALRHADEDGEWAPPPALPVPTPPWSETLAHLERRAATRGSFPALAKASRARAEPTRAELVGVLTEVFAVMDRNKVAIRLINSTARELPELAELWFERVRAVLVTDLERYLRRLERAGCLAPTPDLGVAARLVIETNVWFAVHRHFDPRPMEQPEELVRAAVVDLLARTLWREGD